MNKLEYSVKLSRLSVNGKEVANPVVLFLLTFFPQALGAVLFSAFLARFMPVAAAIIIALVVFYNFGLVAFLMAVGHPVLRAFGRRGFVQRDEQTEENFSAKDSGIGARTLIKFTTAGALERR